MNYVKVPANNIKPEKYLVCLVSSNQDIICITTKSCLVCTQRKLNLTILKMWDATVEDLIDLQKNGTRRYRVSCDCIS